MYFAILTNNNAGSAHVNTTREPVSTNASFTDRRRTSHAPSANRIKIGPVTDRENNRVFQNSSITRLPKLNHEAYDTLKIIGSTPKAVAC